ncbi:PKD domain-containing protein [Flavobacteriaceae bacterium TP-CH-4]|uniref:PKD domain-containing protein n=1 Tax=Pelagihabitans pacificus TaxID=2696054 RepID=A0A967ECT0_9FLAO|nr:PKD domain-containing protein [Pelagihabitans pacificus]NHF58608.1 PKD domain-containing protein [Pelagihabitans pacificus]
MKTKLNSALIPLSFLFFVILIGCEEDDPTADAPYTLFTFEVADLTVAFRNGSTDNPESYNWDFGDGQTSTEVNPTHTYQEGGTYTVVLTASNGSGEDQFERTVSVTEPEEPLPPVVFESFDSYTADATVEGQGGASDGWAGAWTKLTGDDLNVVSKVIINNDIAVVTSGNSLVLDASGTNTRYKRNFATPYVDNGNTYWFAFHAEFANADIDGGEVQVMLVDNDAEAFGAGGGDGQFLGIGKTITPGALGIMTFGPFNNVEATTATADGPLWLVAKIETNGTEDPDVVRLFVNPTPGVEPAQGTEVVTFNAPELNGGWQGIGFKYAGGNASSVTIDDIYVGNTYQDVTPLNYVDLPPPIFETFDSYTADATVAGQGTAADGWAGPWTQLSGGAVNVVSGGVSNGTLSVETTGNSLLLDATVGASRYKRGLSEAFLDDGRTYWFAFQAEFDGATEDTGELVVMLVDNDAETFGGGGGNGQFLGIGKTITPGAPLGIMTFGPFNNIDATDVSVEDGPLWVVAKIETNGTAEPDLVRVFVNPTPGTAPADGTEVVSFAAPELNGGWQGIGFKFNGGATTAKIDDIYLGYRFADVTPENY